MERSKRTIQEEFMDNHLDHVHDTRLFHPKLPDDLICYNPKRIHKSLNTKHRFSLSLKKEKCRKCPYLIKLVDTILRPCYNTPEIYLSHKEGI